jgi:pyruvate dehydrogenase kinase 2/3/4
LAAVLTEIYLCGVCSCQEILRRNGRGQSEDIVIKVSDEGGGIPRSLMNKVFSYSFSTADSEQALQVVQHDFGTSSPLAGLGYGLPVARSYARYFGGDLVVIPVEGYGTDAFVYHLRVRSLMIRS